MVKEHNTKNETTLDEKLKDNYYLDNFIKHTNKQYSEITGCRTHYRLQLLVSVSVISFNYWEHINKHVRHRIDQ